MITAMTICVMLSDGTHGCVAFDATEAECGEAIVAVHKEFDDELSWATCTPVVQPYAMRPVARPEGFME